MTPKDIIQYAREDFLDDIAEPFLWSDNVLERYLNLARMEACRRASLLFDDTTAVDQASPALPLCSLTVVAGTGSYVVSQKILRILKCTPASTHVAIEKKTEDWLDEFWPEWRAAQGDPVYYLEEKGRVRFVPEPVSNDTMQFTIARLPLVDVTIAGVAVLEIPEEYHMQLIDFMCHLAYRKPDAETENIPMADTYEQNFTKNFGPKLSAITEINRRRKPRNRSLRPKEFGFS